MVFTNRHKINAFKNSLKNIYMWMIFMNDCVYESLIESSNEYIAITIIFKSYKTSI